MIKIPANSTKPQKQIDFSSLKNQLSLRDIDFEEKKERDSVVIIIKAHIKDHPRVNSIR